MLAVDSLRHDAKLDTKSLEELADWAANLEAGRPHNLALIEFRYRDSKALADSLESSEAASRAQIRAAEAAERTAAATERYVLLMVVSVVVLALGVVVQAVAAFVR